MKQLLVMLVAAFPLFAAGGSGTYELKQSTERSVINLHAKKAGYISVKMLPDCGQMQLLDQDDKILAFGHGYIAIKKRVEAGTYRLTVIPDKSDCTLKISVPQ